MSRNVTKTDLNAEALYVDGRIRALRLVSGGNTRSLEIYRRVRDPTRHIPSGLFERVVYSPGGNAKPTTVNPDNLDGYRRALLSSKPPEEVTSDFKIPVSSQNWVTLGEGWFTVDDTNQFSTTRDLNKALAAIQR